MNTSMLRIAALLAVLTGAVQAADQPPPPVPDEPARERIEREMQRAQEQMERAAREMAELSTRLNGAAWAQVQPLIEAGPPHVMLGINIGPPRPTEAGSADGVRIVSVSPGGPADIAGLKANDVIVSLAGKELKADPKSSAQHQLLAIMHDARPDTPLAVEYRRDGKLQKAQVVPKSLGEYLSDSVTRGLRGLPDDSDDHGFRIWRQDRSGFGSAELTELSPGLGRYFGTDKGLLVVRAPRDERLKLQDGDVILDIDGRVPSGVSHAYQILSSYHAGETLKLRVMRQQKRLELAVEIPLEMPAGPSHPEASHFMPGAESAGHALRRLPELTDL
jgi:S1-C subfamily serine protease